MSPLKCTNNNRPTAKRKYFGFFFITNRLLNTTKMNRFFRSFVRSLVFVFRLSMLQFNRFCFVLRSWISIWKSVAKNFSLFYRFPRKFGLSCRFFAKKKVSQTFKNIFCRKLFFQKTFSTIFACFFLSILNVRVHVLVPVPDGELKDTSSLLVNLKHKFCFIHHNYCEWHVVRYQSLQIIAKYACILASMNR